MKWKNLFQYKNMWKTMTLTTAISVACMTAPALSATTMAGEFSLSADAMTESAGSAQIGGAVESETTSAPHYFNVASVSKTYVTVAAMQLVDEGLVDLDAPVYEYIPEFHMKDARYKDITVRMLMNHTSGLMGSIYSGASHFGEVNSDYHDEFLTLLNQQELKYTPGEYDCYCNDGFTLLEILVEKVSGKTFTDYLEEKICKPLSLENTGSMWTVADHLDTQVPYVLNGNIKLAPECLHVIGAGGITSDAPELCIFGTAFFHGNNVLLSQKAKDEMARNYTSENAAFTYGLGWDKVHVKEYEEKGVKVLQKGGDANFHHSSLLVAPKEEISVAVLSSGGSSSLDETISYKLLDIVLEERGKEIEHEQEKTYTTVDQIPAEYKKREGLYQETSSQSIVEITFPDMRYMNISWLTLGESKQVQCLFTEDGEFVKVSGDVESGKAMVQKPVTPISFEEIDGHVYAKTEEMGYILEKIDPNPASEKALKAWDARNGKNYYYYNGSYSDMTYAQASFVTLCTNEKAVGYVNNWAIVDETHAKNEMTIPGGMGVRDLTNLEISKKDEYEFLAMPENNATYISEDCIPDFSTDINEVTTTKGAASWYRLNGTKDVTVKLDIPERASVFVFDRFHNLTYTSFMKDFGTSVPLPEYGMIVFVGDTGSSIGIEY